MRWAKDPNVRYGGIFLITIGAFPGGPGFLAWAANNAAGPAIRSVSTAYVVTLGTAGGIVATWYVGLLIAIEFSRDTDFYAGRTLSKMRQNTQLDIPSTWLARSVSCF